MEIDLLQNAPQNKDNDDEVSKKGCSNKNRCKNDFDLARSDYVSVMNLSRIFMPTTYNQTCKTGGDQVG